MDKIEVIIKDNIGWKDAINWGVTLLAAFISAKYYFSSKKENKELKKSQDKKIDNLNEKLNDRLIKEIEDKKDLERQKEKSEESLQWSKMFLSHAEKGKEELEKANRKLENARNQLRFILSSYGVLQEELGVDENISLHEWEKNPEIKKKVEEITRKDYKKWLESEKDVFNLSTQLEEKGIPWYEQRFSDERLKERVISFIEGYWKYGSHIKADTNNEIKGKTIEEVLTKHWKEHLQSKKGKEIIEEGRRLMKLIDDFTSEK